MIVDKNKLAEPYKVCPYTIMDAGISTIETTISHLLEIGAIVKSGTWFKDSVGNPLAQGLLNMSKLLTPSKEAELIKMVDHNNVSQKS